MPDTSVVRQQASFDDVDLQLAVRSISADHGPPLSLTVPLPVQSAEGPSRAESVDRRGWGALLLPGGVLGVGAALLFVAVVSVSQRPAPAPPMIAIPAGSVPTHAVPVPAAGPTVTSVVIAPPVIAPPVVAQPADSTPVIGMPQQRLRQLLTRLADRR